MSQNWDHDALAADLAQQLRSDQRMVWTDMQLGPSGSPRPDVYTLERSYSRPQPTAYEIKVSRSDLRADTTSGKWQKYLSFAGAVIFAVPDGLCTPADIPAGCGLIVRKAEVWRHVRKATRSAVTLPMDASMKLLIDGVSRTVGRQLPSPRKIELWKEHEAVRLKFGEAVARAARDIASAEGDAKLLMEQRRSGMVRVDLEVKAHRQHLMDAAKRDMAAFEQAKLDLIAWLDLPEASGAIAVRRAVADLRRDCDGDARVTDAARKLADARRALETALRCLPTIEEPAPATPPAWSAVA